jgi:pSer/pThr/pTyr-binding forkhead associated (FHA) protein
MHLTLQPIENQEIAPIEINQALFAIGRHSAPFDSYPGKLVDQLSRRHARLFEDKGSIFLMDIGSQNGTRINGSPLGAAPTPVAPGDEIQFGTLRFKVINHASDELTSRQEVGKQIQLRAAGDDKATLVVVNELPCLVGRSEGIIAEYCTLQSIDNQLLSRRHALFFADGDALCLEDLGSTNGTRVNGEPLSGDPITLSDGDQVQFGGLAALSFRLSILLPGADLEATVVGPQAATGPGDDALPERPPTIWMDKPDSFLEVFCEAPEDQAAEVQDVHPESGASRAVWDYIRSEWHALMLHETAVPGLRRPVPLVRYTCYAVPFIAVVLTTFLLLRENPLQEARERLDAGDYHEAASIASASMEPGETNTALASLSTEAALNWMIPPWLDAMQREDTSSAMTTLRDTDFITDTNAEIEAIVQLLAWATDLQQTLAQFTPDAAVAISTNQEKIHALIQTWESNVKLNQHHLGVIVQRRPEFEPMEARILSLVRGLRNMESVYLTAISILMGGIEAALDIGDREQAGLLLRDFGDKYPSVTGTEALEEDLQAYGNLFALLQRAELIAMAQMRAGYTFQTPVFERGAKRHLDPALPSAHELEQFRVAEDAWQSGDYELARTTLQTLVEQGDNEAARARLARQQATMQEYRSLAAGSSDTGNAAQLLDLNSRLDPQTDKHLYASLQPQVEHAKAAVLGQVDGLIVNAEALWAQYQESGGITARLRLETAISQAFEQQAGYLANAHSELSLAENTLRLIPISLDENTGLLAIAVAAELDLQRSSIEDLRLLLGNEVADQKLKLLKRPINRQE